MINAGEIYENSSKCTVPILHRAGDISREFLGTQHWWKNAGSTTVGHEVMSHGWFTLAFCVSAFCAGVMGFAIQRGATCTVAAVDELVTRQRATRLVSIVEASAWVVAGLLFARALGVSWTMPAGYPVGIATMLGGALLGFGAYVNRACVFGAIARLGSGEWAYVATPVGFYVGCLRSRCRIAARALRWRDRGRRHDRAIPRHARHRGRSAPLRCRWTADGLGSLLIPGSNDGLILVGMPLLLPHAWVAFLTMCVVIAAAILVRALLASAAVHAGKSMPISRTAK